jgi:hypothetical protein
MKLARTLIVTLVLLLALIQAPLFFYFTSGTIKMFGLIIYAIMGFCLTALMLYLILKRDFKNNVYNITVLGVSFLLGVLTLRPDIIEYLDWKYRLDERMAIIDGVKQNKIKPDQYGIAHVVQHTFLPVSNGGNDILVKNNLNGLLSVEFYTDRTLIEHYSAFLYTTDPNEMGVMDRSSEHDRHFAHKLDENWYIVHY